METMTNTPTSVSGKVLPLRRLREAAGLTAREVIEKGATISDRFIKTTDHLYILEGRGTTNHHYIVALARIYNLDTEVVAREADYS